MVTPHLQPVYTGFNPTRQDVQIAARILMGLQLPHHASSASASATTSTTTTPSPNHLPPELALSILEHAGYRPRITASRADEVEYHANDYQQPEDPVASVAALYLTTQTPLPAYFRHASAVTLQVRGADQGWTTSGGEGTYENSHTWFEACILRPVPGGATGGGGSQLQGLPLEAAPQMWWTFQTPGDARLGLEQLGWQMVDHGGRDTWLVHYNATASEDWKNHRVDWVADTPTEIDVQGAVGDGEGFLSALMPGDMIGLWARAEQQDWVIKVAEAVIEVVYDVWQ